MGYAVPGGLVQYYAAQQGGAPMPPRTGSAPPSGMHPHPHPHGMGMGPGPGPGLGQYTNRHLFVGNLPFNCQWQELKDLMRGAGSATVNNPPPHHQHSPQHPFRPQHGHHGPPPPQPPMPYGNGQQQQFGGLVRVPYCPQTFEHLVAQPVQASSPLSQLAHSPSLASSRPRTAVTRPGLSPWDQRSPHAAPAQPHIAPSPTAAAASLSLPLSSSFPDGSRGVTAPTAAAPSPPAPSFARGRSHLAAPSRIAIPLPLPAPPAKAKAATTSTSAPPLSPDVSSLASAHSKSEGTIAALGRAFDGLSVMSAGAGAGAPAGMRSLQSFPRVSPPALPAEGSPPRRMRDGGASADGGAAFGTSIWG
ncbi:hypothetical protein JCM10449v2_003627 [Rhodotorula kratochvilovae]